MFRNLTFFRFPVPAQMSDFMHRLNVGTLANPLNPVGPLELASRGWVSPAGQPLPPDHELAYCRGYKVWLTLGSEEKILPGAVVAKALADKLADMERTGGRKPGGRARKALKEQIVHELLPRAFVRPGRLDGYLDLRRGLLVVDTASRKQAEGFASELRRALGSFPALPLNAEVAPRAVLTGWIAGEPLPDGVLIGDEAILKDAADRGAKATLSRQELGSDEVTKHLESGKQVTRLALTFDDHVSFTLDEDLVVRKFKYLDAAVDQLESTERDDLQAELDARFVLLTGEVGTLFDMLERVLKLSKVEA